MSTGNHQELDIFSESFRALKKAARKSQIEIANAVGVSQATVSNWENAAIMPGAAELLRLSKLFGVPMERFFQKLHNATFAPIQEFGGILAEQRELYGAKKDDLGIEDAVNEFRLLAKQRPDKAQEIKKVIYSYTESLPGKRKTKPSSGPPPKHPDPVVSNLADDILSQGIESVKKKGHQ